LRRLADAGLILWPDETLVAVRLPVHQAELPPISYRGRVIA
jgi:hypothetical protein